MNRTGGSLLIVLALLAGACSGDPATATPASASVSPTPAGSDPTATPTTASATSSALPSSFPATTVPPCAIPEAGTHTTEFQARERSYQVVTPATISEGTPLLLLLHGFTSRPDRILRHSGFDELGPANDIVVVAPLATGNPTSWEIIPPNDPDDPTYAGPNDLGFLTDLVGGLRSEYPCLGEVWAAGLSAGSAMASFFMCSAPDGLVGVGLVAALIPAVCQPSSIRQMLVFHGTDDIVVPYVGGEQAVDDGSFALPGVESSAVAWAELAGCGEGTFTLLADDVELRSFPGCVEGASVALHSYLGGNHNWPGGADDQLPPIIESLPSSCVLVHAITHARGDVYDTCLRG